MSPLGHLRAITTLALAILVTLAVSGCASPTATAMLPASPPSYADHSAETSASPRPEARPEGSVEPRSRRSLARHYAPVIRQGVASDQDFITAVDFDGDWVGSNNWENQPTGDLSAYVYYSVVETETHWFLFYALFHPRDYTPKPCQETGGCHENDLESIQLVAAKDGTPFGKLLAVETLAHDAIYLYPLDSSVRPNVLKAAGQIRFEESHPIVYIETYGHGIYGTRRILVPGKVTYRVGDVAEVPEGIKDDNTSYRLVPIYETLWTHRDEIGPGRAFDQPFDYRGHILPAAIDGEDYGQDRANTPWGYSQETGDTLSRGDWFLDPAKALTYHARFEGELSRKYVYSPYLADLGLSTLPTEPML